MWWEITRYIIQPSEPFRQELEEEILGLDRAFHEKFGINMKFLRPPKANTAKEPLP